MKGLEEELLEQNLKKTLGENPETSSPSVNTVKKQRGSIRGEKMRLPDGTEHIFQTELISPNDIDARTFVFHGNDRDQDLLSPETTQYLRDAMESAGGQIFPAYGRLTQDGRIEIACGSSRRFVCRLDGWCYKVKFAKGLTDEQMERLAELENQYKSTSPYEKGRKYIKIMQEQDIEKVGRLESYLKQRFEQKQGPKPPSRKSLSRFIKTGQLPIEVVSLFSEPNDISASAGEKMYDFLAQRIIPSEKMKSRYDYIRTERYKEPEMIVSIICGKEPNKKVESISIGNFKVTGRKIDCSKLSEEEFERVTDLLKTLN